MRDNFVLPQHWGETDIANSSMGKVIQEELIRQGWESPKGIREMRGRILRKLKEVAIYTIDMDLGDEKNPVVYYKIEKGDFEKLLKILEGLNEG